MIKLHGSITCATQEEADRIKQFLPEHIRLSRNEPGCISFIVSETEDSLVWSVEEVFVDQASFDKHQKRMKTSDWGKATLGISREYEIEVILESDTE